MTTTRPKVFGIGMPKTGTTTLGQCLRALGYNLHEPAWPDRMALLEDWIRGDRDSLRAAVEAHDAFEDIPWCLAFRWLDEEFPGSRFVLTRRRDPERWLASVKPWSIRHSPDLRRSRELLYGYDYPQGHEKVYLDRYVRSLDEVRAYFRGRDDLVEVCWDEGHGWDELCPFLGAGVPQWSFPNANSASSGSRITRWTPVNHVLRLWSEVCGTSRG